jgi:hypothetical protein
MSSGRDSSCRCTTARRINFLEPPDEFLASLDTPVTRLDTSDGNAEALLGTTSEPTIALLSPPLPQA